MKKRITHKPWCDTPRHTNPADGCSSRPVPSGAWLTEPAAGTVPLVVLDARLGDAIPLDQLTDSTDQLNHLARSTP